MAEKTLETFFASLADESKQEKLEQVFTWISKTYPNLQQKIAWNQPVYTDHGTYIVGFSAAKKHFALAFEAPTMQEFEAELATKKVDRSKMLIRIPWQAEIDYDLLSRMIEFTVKNKKDVNTFWYPATD